MSHVDLDDFVYRPPGAPPRTQRVYSEDGVDLTLIRWMLSLTPGERLRHMQEFINAADRILEHAWKTDPTSKRS